MFRHLLSSNSARNCDWMGEGEVCLAVLTDGVTEDENLSRTELKRDHQYLLDDAEPDSFPNKKQAKEVSNEDVRSEVSNPNISPKETTSTVQEFTSQAAKLGNSNQVECGEVTSTCSGSSSADETLSDGDRSRNDTSRVDDNASGAVETSLIVREIPKHANSTGIRKITFKFSKRKEDYDNQTYASVVRPERESSAVFGSDREMLESKYRNDYPESSKFCSRAPNVEFEISKKVVPTNVKKLLGTGILDGAQVKYISTSGQVNYFFFYMFLECVTV